MTLPTNDDIARHSLAAIPTGTPVDDLPPRGFSHNIIKIQGKLAEGDVKKVLQILLENQDRFHIVLAADVATAHSPDSRPYHLKHLAAGVAAHIEGRLVIVSTNSKPNPVSQFGLFAVLQLAGEEKHIKDVHCRVACRSPQLAVRHVPLVYRENGEHIAGWRRDW